MLPEYAEPCKQALTRLLQFFNGNKSQLAAACGVSRNCVSFWFAKGYIGKYSAMIIDMDPMIPMSKEELRPDIRVWSAYKQPERKV